MAKLADIGLIGLAVMGENLVMNMESKGFTVAVFNRTTEKVKAFTEGRANGKNIIGTYSLEELVSTLKKPRKVFMMVKAGKPVEECRADFEAVIAEGIKNGADYFILGCTELPIAADELKLPYNFADPTYALARAAILFCGYETV